MTTPADPSAVDAEIARLMAALSSGSPTLADIKTAVKLARPKRVPKEKPPATAKRPAWMARALGRFNATRTRLAQYERDITSTAMHAQITAKAHIHGERMSLACMVRDYARDIPEIAAAGLTEWAANFLAEHAQARQQWEARTSPTKPVR